MSIERQAAFVIAGIVVAALVASMLKPWLPHCADIAFGFCVR